MHHIQLLQILFETTIQVAVRVPQKAGRRFCVVLEALVEVHDRVVVLHVALHAVDDVFGQRFGGAAEFRLRRQAACENREHIVALTIGAAKVDKVQLVELFEGGEIGVLVVEWNLG